VWPVNPHANYTNELFRRSTSNVFGKVTPVDDAHMYWTHGCGWGLWGSGQKASRGLTADPTQHLPADADLWSESTD